MTKIHPFFELDVSQALCAQTDPEMFFPDKGQSASSAKAVCRECPIQKECLEVAIKNDYTDGIWGGLAPRQRDALAGRRGRVWTEPKRRGRSPVKEVRVNSRKGERNVH